MGLLDDAIREHLDLKRRSGADPAEIEKLEHDALGPVRRGPEEQPARIEFAERAEPDEDQEFEDEDEELGWDEQELAEGDEELEPEHDLGHEAPRHPAPHPARPSADRSTEPQRPPHTVGQETEEYDVEHESEGEDVLQETPEFLQDTPDHDRLWFEQRPPRDFDFEG